MNRLVRIAILTTVLVSVVHAFAVRQAQGVAEPASTSAQPTAMSPTHGIAFSPYVTGYDPNSGPQPGPELVDRLMQRVRAMGFRRILVYGATPGFDAVYEAAERYGVRVIAIIWLDKDAAANQASIAAGIQRAKAQPQTIERLSCGSEVRTRHGLAVSQPLIEDCLAQVRAADVSQPVGSIDSWWGWCNEAWPCQTWGLATKVDWIGVNIYPWWENKYSGIFPCTPAGEAAAFTVARYQAMRSQYAGQEVLLTEFGWPAGPHGHAETNVHTGQRCGIAGAANQRLVVEQTLAALDAAGLPGIVFEAFQEPWKTASEGPVGAYWGVCGGDVPYSCPFVYGLRRRAYAPMVLVGPQ